MRQCDCNGCRIALLTPQRVTLQGVVVVQTSTRGCWGEENQSCIHGIPADNKKEPTS